MKTKLTPAEMVTVMRLCSNLTTEKCGDCPICHECAEITTGDIYRAAADMIEELAETQAESNKDQAPIVYHVHIEGTDEAVETMQGIADKINAAISLADDLAAKLGSLKVNIE